MVNNNDLDERKNCNLTLFADDRRLHGSGSCDALGKASFWWILTGKVKRWRFNSRNIMATICKIILFGKKWLLNRKVLIVFKVMWVSLPVIINVWVHWAVKKTNGLLVFISSGIECKGKDLLLELHRATERSHQECCQHCSTQEKTYLQIEGVQKRFLGGEVKQTGPILSSFKECDPIEACSVLKKRNSVAVGSVSLLSAFIWFDLI